MKIYSNKIRCKHCGDIIESKHVHDFKYCSCQFCAVDGGLEYLRRVYKNSPEEDYEELSEYSQEEDREEPSEYKLDADYGELYKREPKGERMGDLISRKAAFEAIEQLRQKHYYYDSANSVFLEAEEIINKLPFNEDSWTPIDKGFPQPYENVMISYDTGYGGCVDIGHIINNGNWRARDNYRLISMNSVNAWMPLPREYKVTPNMNKEKGN